MYKLKYGNKYITNTELIESMKGINLLSVTLDYLDAQSYNYLDADNNLPDNWYESAEWGYTEVICNGDKIRQCTNEQLMKVYKNLKTNAIYVNGELMSINYYPGHFLAWLNKESDKVDEETIFNFS